MMSIDFIIAKVVDIGLIQLCIAFTFLFYCFSLLVWWWAKVRLSSEMYACIVVLIFACLINSGLGIYVRVLGAFNREAYYAFLHSAIWEWRYTPFNIVVIIISYRTTIKIREEIKKIKG